MKTSGEAAALILYVLVALGAALFVVKPKLFPGDSRRAEQNSQANQKLEEVTQAQGSSAAASVASIGQAAALAPQSPATDYIIQEVPVALSKLPAPDAAALIEAERRRTAVMEGRLDEARRLFQTEAQRASQLQKERDEALIKQREATVALQESAAVAHSRFMQSVGLGVIALIAVGLWIASKVYGVNLQSMGKIVADIRSGGDPIAAIDAYTSPRLHPVIQKYAKLDSKLPEPPNAP